MDKVLLVDSNRDYLTSLKEGLDKMRQFEVLVAEDALQAIEIFTKQQISVLVTDINTPKMDGLELIAYMTQNHPAIPVIVMTDYGKPWFRRRMDQQEVLYHLEKPFEIGALASAIFVGLNLKDEGTSYRGMTMSSLLPLIEVEQKTCRMEVKTSGRGKGYLYFDEGVLIDAHFKGFSGEKAALEMAKWDRIAIKFTELPRRRTRTKVKTDLMDMAGATWMKEDTDDIKGTDSSTIRRELLNLDDTATDEDIATGILEKHVAEFRNIKGFIGVAITDRKGRVLAQDCPDGGYDLSSVAGELQDIVAKSMESAEKCGINKLVAVTIHAADGIVLVVKSPLPSTANYQLVGVTTADGNWFYMKVQMENFFPRLGSVLSEDQ
ncbi:MAG: response regulator [Desulfobacterales bacterium]|jgi:CheY-like chemotaxis protein